MGRLRRVVLAVSAVSAVGGVAVTGLFVAAESSRAGTGSCTAAVGFEGPLTGQVSVLGMEQLHFAQLAVSAANAANGTSISVVARDTQLLPSKARAVTQQFISNGAIVAVAGPAGSLEVRAVGPLFASAGLAFISGSATNSTLIGGADTTFFRVVPSDDLQGPGDAHYIIHVLHPRAVLLIDDKEPYSTGLARSIIPQLRRAGIRVDRASVSQTQTRFGTLVRKVTPASGVVILPWKIAGRAQRLGAALERRHSKAVLFGTDGLFVPGTFTVPGSLVSSFAPDITAIPADRAIVNAARSRFGAFGTFAGPAYAATTVIANAIAAVCRTGQQPTRANVLAAIRQTNEPTSILGQPIPFSSHGELAGAHYFLFKIDKAGRYRMLITRRGAPLAPSRDPG